MIQNKIFRERHVENTHSGWGTHGAVLEYKPLIREYATQRNMASHI